MAAAEMRQDEQGPSIWWAWTEKQGQLLPKAQPGLLTTHSLLCCSEVHAWRKTSPLVQQQFLGRCPTINPQLSCQEDESNQSQKNNDSLRPPTTGSPTPAWSKETHAAETLHRHWYQWESFLIYSLHSHVGSWPMAIMFELFSSSQVFISQLSCSPRSVWFRLAMLTVHFLFLYR